MEQSKIKADLLSLPITAKHQFDKEESIEGIMDQIKRIQLNNMYCKPTGNCFRIGSNYGGNIHEVFRTGPATFVYRTRVERD